jgi:Rrf2 family protein
VRISAKADYALRAAAELAAAGGGPVKGDKLAGAQGIPPKFLENILSDLRQSGLIRSQRGAEGGYWLARPAEEISVADVMRAVDGTLATVRGQRPEDVEYTGAAEELKRVWIALRHNVRAVVENVTVADIGSGRLPDDIVALADDPEAWVTRQR